MSEYKGIKGFQVQTRTTDPTPYAEALRNNPYVGSWSSGGSLNTARNTLMAAGTRDANLAFAGEASGNSNLVELYNGTSWSEQAEVNTAVRGGSGAGSSTSAIKVGGYTGSAIEESVESWNGSAWTEIAELNTDRQEQAASGASNTSSLVFGGVTQISPGVYTADTETWNGSAWTEVNELNGAAKDLMGNGTATSALAIGGYRPPGSTRSGNTESWNGTSWTEVNEASTARTFGGASGSDNTNSLVYAGDVGTSPASAGTESWDGTNWTEVADLSVARYRISGSPSGTSVAALATGGLNAADSNQSATEEWAFSGLDPSTTPATDYADGITGDFYYNSTTGQFKQVNTGGAPIGTWASGGDLLAATSGMAAFGTQTAALSVGGYLGPPGATAKNEEYDGTSFTEKADINQARYGLRGAGSTTAGFVAGGPAPNNNLVESWNGSSWTETTEMASGKENGAACGTQTAFLIFGGVPPATGDVNTFYWNGSSWTEGGDMNQAKRNLAGFGVYNSAIAAGGETPSVTNNTESYDGTSWTEVNEMNTARRALAGSGLSTAGLVYGGTTGSDSTKTESWNGTSWTEQADLATGRLALGGAGTLDTQGFAIGGEDPVQTGTEEFFASDFQIKTVTTS